MTRAARPEPLRITLLGGFRVAVGSRLIEETAWPLRKAASVVKLLALAPGHRRHRGRVLDLLWPDLEPAAALNNLHGALHAARRVLEPDLVPPKRSAYLCLRDDVLILCPEGALWLDVEAFEAAGAAARCAQDPAAYEAALALYSGDLLPQDRYEDWAARRRDDVRALYLSLLVDRAQLHEARHEYAAAVATLEQVVAGEPTAEDAHVALMRLYALLGQRSQALRQYQRLRDALRRDLDAEPAAASRQLYHDILAGRCADQPAGGLAPGWLESEGIPATRRRSSSVFRLPPSAYGGRTNLPLLLTGFIGREQEMAEVTRLLARTRLLTLTGTGGCGKTRLALQVAAPLVDAYPDGVWLVELASLADPRLVPQAWAVVLGVQEEPGRALGEILADALRPKHLLVVLDNCEHLVDAHAHLAEALLQACPHLHILATSREPLNISGEVAWRVPSLALPAPAPLPPLDCLAQYDAVRLFLERARASRPKFALTRQNAPAVVQVCRRLEGLPLALELAAARLTVLSVEQLAARMDACLELLTTGRRTALPRQQTLRATLEWSYGLLSPREQMLFRRLAVFAGVFALEAAEGVCTGAGLERAGLLDLLTQLVNKSLLLVEEQEERASYRLLETLRQYGMEKLEEAGEAAEMRRRHTEWYLALAADPAATREIPVAGRTPASLTRREHEIALLLASGRTDRQIAAHLALSERTVSTHVSHILARLGLASRAQVAAWATARRLHGLHAPGAS